MWNLSIFIVLCGLPKVAMLYPYNPSILVAIPCYLIVEKETEREK